MTTGVIVFVLMVATAVFLLSQGLFVPTLGDTAKTRKRLRQRLEEIDSGSDTPFASLLREKYLVGLTPFRRRLENLPGMEPLAQIIEQAGKKTLAHELVLFALALGVAGGIIGWLTTRLGIVGLIAAMAGIAVPFIKVNVDRKNRFANIEEQLPDAIDTMKRALRAGHPFATCLQMVAEDMDEPIASEFQTTFSDINYGNDLRRAMLGLLNRIPSVTVMALVTSVRYKRKRAAISQKFSIRLRKLCEAGFVFIAGCGRCRRKDACQPGCLRWCRSCSL